MRRYLYPATFLVGFGMGGGFPTMVTLSAARWGQHTVGGPAAEGNAARSFSEISDRTRGALLQTSGNLFYDTINI